MKRCIECGDELADEEFPIRNSATGARRGQCFDCYRRICRKKDRERQQRRRDKNKSPASSTARMARHVPVFDFQREDWQAEGLCRGKTDRFFPGQGGDSETPKRICHNCPVESQCLEYAIRTCQTFGIWGGKSEKERRDIRRQRRSAAA